MLGLRHHSVKNASAVSKFPVCRTSHTPTPRRFLVSSYSASPTWRDIVTRASTPRCSRTSQQPGFASRSFSVYAPREAKASRGEVLPNMATPSSQAQAQAQTNGTPPSQSLRQAQGQRGNQQQRQDSIEGKVTRQLFQATNNGEKDAGKEKGQEPATIRSKARQTSLRSVGIAAAKKRQIIQDKGGLRMVDPGIQTKKVTAYCAAEQYSISHAARLIRAEGFDLDPFSTGLYPQVIHIQTPIYAHDPAASPSSTAPASDHNPRSRDHGDLFIFPSGTVVAWNVPERTALRLVERVLPPAALNSHSGSLELEKEDLEYIEAPEQERSSIVGDTIILGTSTSNLTTSEESESDVGDGDREREHPEKPTILAKIAFSSGLARSTKLAVLERLTESYVVSTRNIPTIMSRGTPLPFARPALLRRLCEILGFGSRLPFSRPFILRKTGELLSIRAQLNLYSELTDSLPDLFWDSRHELGLENYYEHVGKALDVGVRIKVLNEKLGYAQEIAQVLRETLSERHDLRLEWIIILLIAIEVVFELGRWIGEAREKGDPHNLEELQKRWFEEQLRRKDEKAKAA